MQFEKDCYLVIEFGVTVKLLQIVIATEPVISCK